MRSANLSNRLANMGGVASLRLFALLVTSAMILSGCSRPLDEAELADAKERWDEAGPTSSEYMISLNSNWGDLRLYRIEINEGSFTVLEPAERHNDLAPENLLDLRELFDTAKQRWLREEHSEVTFNEDYGYIELVESDDPNIEDDRLITRVTDFKELNP